MKKTAAIFLTLLAVVLLAVGCGAQAPGGRTREEVPTQPSGQSQPEQMSSQEEKSVNQEPLMIADASLYRGTLAAVDTALNGQVLYRLEAFEGSGFAPMLLGMMDSGTRASFDLATLAVGDHLEVYYTPPAPGAERCDLDTYTILAINRLYPAAAVYYNGTLVEYLDSGDGTGTLTLEPLEKKQGASDPAANPVLDQFVFHWGPQTQFYLDRDALVPGTKLNIYHKGIMTMSIPPQGVALEVRLYGEPSSQKEETVID